MPHPILMQVDVEEAHRLTEGLERALLYLNHSQGSKEALCALAGHYVAMARGLGLSQAEAWLLVTWEDVEDQPQAQPCSCERPGPGNANVCDPGPEGAFISYRCECKCHG
jgi:hypothetical protein